jgi:hypothetical protein
MEREVSNPISILRSPNTANASEFEGNSGIISGHGVHFGGSPKPSELRQRKTTVFNKRPPVL